MIKKYIQVEYQNKWYLCYCDIDKNNKIYFWYPKIKPFFEKTINFKIYNDMKWKLFSGHLYFIYLITLNKLKYIPCDIRQKIWFYLNLDTI